MCVARHRQLLEMQVVIVVKMYFECNCKIDQDNGEGISQFLLAFWLLKVCSLSRAPDVGRCKLAPVMASGPLARAEARTELQGQGDAPTPADLA